MLSGISRSTTSFIAASAGIFAAVSGFLAVAMTFAP